MRLMGDNAPLPGKTEHARKEAVRDGKAADERNSEGNRQSRIDDERSRPPDAPRAPAKRGKPFPVPREVKQHENSHDDAQRLMQRLRQDLKAHHQQEKRKQQPIQ